MLCVGCLLFCYYIELLLLDATRRFGKGECDGMILKLEVISLELHINPDDAGTASKSP